MTSTLPKELIVARPFAFGMHPAVVAAAERTILKVVFWADAVKLANATSRPKAIERLTTFMVLKFLSDFSFRAIVLGDAELFERCREYR